MHDRQERLAYFFLNASEAENVSPRGDPYERMGYDWVARLLAETTPARIFATPSEIKAFKHDRDNLHDTTRGFKLVS